MCGSSKLGGGKGTLHSPFSATDGMSFTDVYNVYIYMYELIKNIRYVFILVHILMHKFVQCALENHKIVFLN